MARVKILQCTQSDAPELSVITTWMYQWWGEKEDYSIKEVAHIMAHSVNAVRLPQTYTIWLEEKLVGMYQFSLHDLECRPDIYPWLCNVYIVPEARGNGILYDVMAHVKQYMIEKNWSALYLFTTHQGLYEKFGWQFIEEIETFLPQAHWQRLYGFFLS